MGVLGCIRKATIPQSASLTAPFTQGGAFNSTPIEFILALEGSPSPSHITNGKGGVGGGVPDAPSNARALRADIESAPTPTKIWPRRGQTERGKKALRKAQHSCAF